MIIRRVEIDDADALARLHGQCFDAGWDATSLRTMLENPATRAFVAGAAAANELQGFIVIQIAADESEILSLGVVPLSRGKGVAKALLMHGAADAHARGARSMFLDVAETNTAARALYVSAGFVMAGRRTAYYGAGAGPPVDALCLRAHLPL
jgi:ribosomal-protein-alanine N-acetyltransferase